MKCEEVRFALWTENRTDEVEAHVQTCATCQREVQEMEHILEQMRGVKTPVSTRSLVPTREVIRQTVRRNRYRRIKWVSGIAVAIVLVVGTASVVSVKGTTPGLFSHHQVDTVTSKPVPIEVASDASSAPYCQVIGQYLSTHLSSRDVQKIVVTGFTSDVPVAANAGAVQGEVTFNVTLQPLAQVRLSAGTNTSRVMLRKTNGAWAVDVLAETVAPQTPEEAAEKWVEAVKTRNGALEYALLAPELQAVTKSAYQKQNWRIYGSSPYVSTYQMNRSEKLADGTVRIALSLQMKTSGGSAGQELVNLYLKKYGDSWYLTGREYQDISDQSMEADLVLPNQQKLMSTSPNQNSATWANCTVRLQTLGYDTSTMQALQGGSRSILSKELVQVGQDSAMLYLMETSPDQKHEYWLVINRDETDLQVYIHRSYVLIVSSNTGDDQDAKNKVLTLSKSWTVPNLHP